jgi:hypothetical protein
MANLAKLLQDATMTGTLPDNRLPDEGEVAITAPETLNVEEGGDDASVTLSVELDGSSLALEGVNGESVSLKQRPKGTDSGRRVSKVDTSNLS